MLKFYYLFQSMFHQTPGKLHFWRLVDATSQGLSKELPVDMHDSIKAFRDECSLLVVCIMSHGGKSCINDTRWKVRED